MLLVFNSTVVGITGAATDTVHVADAVPPAPVTVAVIVAVPAPAPLTKPFPSTTATAEFELAHVTTTPSLIVALS